MERIDEIVDRLAVDVQHLTTELKNKIEYLRERHRLLAQLEELEPNSEEPMKKLRDRVELLQTIAAYNSPFSPEPVDSFGPLKKLEARIAMAKRICGTADRLDQAGLLGLCRCV
jgi:hypothetical protein